MWCSKLFCLPLRGRRAGYCAGLNAHTAINSADSTSIQGFSDSADEQVEMLDHVGAPLAILFSTSDLEQIAGWRAEAATWDGCGVENVRRINRPLPSRCLKQKRISDRCWATFPCLFSCPSRAVYISSAQTASVIEGTVVNPQGKAIMGAVVSLSGSGLVGETQFWSDASGAFRLTACWYVYPRVFQPVFPLRPGHKCVPSFVASFP